MKTTALSVDYILSRWFPLFLKTVKVMNIINFVQLIQQEFMLLLKLCLLDFEEINCPEFETSFPY